jgi:hypothetical protein
MSAPAAVPFRCSICAHPLSGWKDTEKIRQRGKTTGGIRCSDYENCMLRAARNRRNSLGMEANPI